jgi:hypothetical protein
MTDVTQKIKRTIIPTRAAVRHLPLFGFRPFASKIQASGILESGTVQRDF